MVKQELQKIYNQSIEECARYILAEIPVSQSLLNIIAELQKIIRNNDILEAMNRFREKGENLDLLPFLIDDYLVLFCKDIFSMKKQELQKWYNKCIENLARMILAEMTFSQDLLDIIAKLQRAIQYNDILEEMEKQNYNVELNSLLEKELLEPSPVNLDGFKYIELSPVNLDRFKYIEPLPISEKDITTLDTDKIYKDHVYFNSMLTMHMHRALNCYLAKVNLIQSYEFSELTAAQPNHIGTYNLNSK